MSEISPSFRATETLPDGQPVYIRAIKPSDRDGLRREFHRLSPEAVRDRFFYAKPDLSPAELSVLTEVDFSCHVALVAELIIDSQPRPVGVGRFMCDQERPDRSEVAITVAQGMQGKGIGKALLNQIVHCARELGVSYLDATVLADNKRMSKLLRHSGLPLNSVTRGGISTITISL